MRKRNVRSSKMNSNTTTSSSSSSACHGVDDDQGKVVLVKYDDLPEYMKDNEYIRNYYRCEWPLKNVLISVFSLHNETLNIWTHLVGFMIFTWMMVTSCLKGEISFDNIMATPFREERSDHMWFTLKITNQTNSSATFVEDSYARYIAKSQAIGLRTNHPTNQIPLWPWFVFLLGSMSCLLFSASSHLFACHSRRFYYLFWRLDYTGISLMIVCSFFAPIYYIFLESPNWRFLYLSSIALIGISVVVTLLSPLFSESRFRSFRALLFICMALSGVVPATHALIHHWGHPQIVASLGYEVVMGILYGLGAVFYVARIPERWRAGTFDILGHSHQIFHVFVVLAALAHCKATLIIMEWRLGLLNGTAAQG